MIEFRCACGKLLKAKDDLAGRLTQCPACAKEFTIPGEDAEPGGVEPPTQQRPAWDDHDEGEAAASPARGNTTSRSAIASLILGIASLVLLILAGIPAIILGILGLRDVSRNRGRVRGTGLSVAGLVLGALGCVLTIPLLLIGLLVPAVQKTREAANRMNSQNNLKQIAVALLKYHDEHGRFPPAIVLGKDNKPLYSWRVPVLPYLGEDKLYKQFKLDEPWDSPNNRGLLPQMPAVFHHLGSVGDPSETVYRVFVGPKTAFESPNGQRMAEFVDGTSMTILVVEANAGVPWTEPVDLPFGANAPLPKLGGHTPGGFNAAFADGSVKFIRDDVPEATLRAWITRNGMEVVQPP
jgi:prepilin-type processing-associated H-X9-DG protein